MTRHEYYSDVILSPLKLFVLNRIANLRFSLYCCFLSEAIFFVLSRDEILKQLQDYNRDANHRIVKYVNFFLSGGERIIPIYII